MAHYTDHGPNFAKLDRAQSIAWCVSQLNDPQKLQKLIEDLNSDNMAQASDFLSISHHRDVARRFGAALIKHSPDVSGRVNFSILLGDRRDPPRVKK